MIGSSLQGIPLFVFSGSCSSVAQQGALHDSLLHGEIASNAAIIEAKEDQRSVSVKTAIERVQAMLQFVSNLHGAESLQRCLNTAMTQRS